MAPGQKLRDLPELRDRKGVFRDRADAGRLLAALLEEYRGSTALVLAVPAGGVPVALPLAAALGLPLEVAVVSKITLPWNTEAGYGAVAFDGTVRLNQALIARVGLSPEEVEEGIAVTRRKVERRVAAFREGRQPPALEGRTAILVDDGLASGFTMAVALEAVRGSGAREVAVAVPTGHLEALQRLAPAADRLFCANVRRGASFAVAEAYLAWTDVAEDEALRLLYGRAPRAD